MRRKAAIKRAESTGMGLLFQAILSRFWRGYNLCAREIGRLSVTGGACFPRSARVSQFRRVMICQARRSPGKPHPLTRSFPSPFTERGQGEVPRSSLSQGLLAAGTRSVRSHAHQELVSSARVGAERAPTRVIDRPATVPQRTASGSLRPAIRPAIYPR